MSQDHPAVRDLEEALADIWEAVGEWESRAYRSMVINPLTLAEIPRMHFIQLAKNGAAQIILDFRVPQGQAYYHENWISREEYDSPEQIVWPPEEKL
jgi:hypothetical protein